MMFIEKKFSRETIELLRNFNRQSTWVAFRLGQIQATLPVSIAPIEDRVTFKASMPNTKHHKFCPFDKVFHEDGSPKHPEYHPMREFCRIVLEFERLAGFNHKTARYDLNGRTENGVDLMKPAFFPHCDGGDPLVRVYLLSDEVAPTIFGGRKTTPYDIYFFSGITHHRAWCANPEFRHLPYVPRNIAHLRIKGGSTRRVFPYF